jgi:hypothetical protein
MSGVQVPERLLLGAQVRHRSVLWMTTHGAACHASAAAVFVYSLLLVAMMTPVRRVLALLPKTASNKKPMRSPRGKTAVVSKLARVDFERHFIQQSLAHVDGRGRRLRLGPTRKPHDREDNQHHDEPRLFVIVVCPSHRRRRLSQPPVAGDRADQQRSRVLCQTASTLISTALGLVRPVTF